MPDTIEQALLGDVDAVKMLLTPSSVFMRVDDNLRVTTFNSAAGVRLEARWRAVLPNGAIIPSGDVHTPNTDRSLKSTIVLTPEGWLLGLEIVVAAGTPRIGQCFVVVEIVRGSSGAVTPLQTLVSGYVSTLQPLGFPGTGLRPSNEGPGVILSVTGTNPAAGAELSQTVPTGARWRLRGISAVLVASAAVASREVTLVIDDGTLVLAQIAVGSAQVASQTVQYTFALGVQRIAPSATLALFGPAPDYLLEAGYRIRTITTALQGTDDWGAPQLSVEEWITG